MNFGALVPNNVKKHWQKRLFEWFYIVIYQNAKTHGKNPIWRNEGTLRETCFVNVFEYQKRVNSTLYGGTKH